MGWSIVHGKANRRTHWTTRKCGYCAGMDRTSRHISPHASHVADHSNTRDLLDIALDVGLHLHALVMGVAALCWRRSALSSQADVLVITNGVLAEATEDFVLFIAK